MFLQKNNIGHTKITIYVFYFRPVAENERKVRKYRPLYIILSNLNGLLCGP